MTTTSDPESVLELRQYTLVPGRRDDVIANATMVDSDDVLLLRPAAEGSGFRTAGLVRAPAGETGGGRAATAAAVVHVSVVEVPAGAEPDLVAWWTGQVEPAVQGDGGRPLGCLVTEPAPNTFPALPVRADEHVLVGVVRYDDDPTYRPEPPAGRVLQRLRLAPTPRSLLR